jgi:hypothetical protein
LDKATVRLSAEFVARRVNEAGEVDLNADELALLHRCSSPNAVQRALVTTDEGSIDCRASMCESCPFRHGSPHTRLAPGLASRALSEASPLCHSSVTHPEDPARLCRGARNAQLDFFYTNGFIAAPTDAAWEKRRRELGLRSPPG